MEAGSYRNTLRRRVTRDEEGMIDLEAIKAKFEECRVWAEKAAKSEREEQVSWNKADIFCDRVKTQIGNYPPHDWNADVSIWRRTPETVTLSATGVTGAQLSEIERVIGKTYTVAVRLDLTGEQAVQIYKLLKGNEKGDTK